jgi:hypothetical protein
MLGRWRGVAGLGLVLGLAACSEGSSDVVASASGTALAPSDEAIAAQLYAGTSRTPPGFVADPVPPSFEQVTTYHVKSQQIAAPAATAFELCTDDWSEAFAWSEEVAARSPEYLDLVSNEATDGYFQFDRVPRGQPQRYVRMRVYRCAYLDRTGVDLATADGFAGTFNRRPLDAAALRALSEYLWLFTPYNNAGHAAIVSAARPGATLTHAITIASLTTVPGGCDRVTLTEWAHTVDAASGALALSVTPVREFGVRRDAGAIAGC